MNYSERRDRLITCYSPVRRSIRTRRFSVARLACLIHAASVRPEPGSNSPLKSVTTASRYKRWGLIDLSSHITLFNKMLNVACFIQRYSVFKERAFRRWLRSFRASLSVSGKRLFYFVPFSLSTLFENLFFSRFLRSSLRMSAFGSGCSSGTRITTFVASGWFPFFSEVFLRCFRNVLNHSATGHTNVANREQVPLSAQNFKKLFT